MSGKIELSPNRAFIDNELDLGVSYRKISKSLEDMGERISHTAIALYHKERDNGNDAEDVFAEPLNVGELGNTAEAATLRRLYRMQLQIVEAKTKAHIEGKAKAPHDDVRTLKAIADMMKSAGLSLRKEAYREDADW